MLTIRPGCGTLGVAVLSGTIASLEQLASHAQLDLNSVLSHTNGVKKWEHHTSGTTTPIGAPDASLPSRFIACVNREESVHNLVKVFHGKGGLSDAIEIVSGENVESVREADVIVLA